MALPKYNELMLPLLKLHADGKKHHRKEFTDLLADQFELSDDEKKVMLQNGRQSLFDNRCGWALLFLKKADLLRQPERGYYEVTERGLKALSDNSKEITLHYLEQFEGFRAFRAGSGAENIDAANVTEENETPDDLLEKGYTIITTSLKEDLINRLRSSTPDFFEKVVLDLMEKMNYGTGKVTGKSGDGGIDGIIYQDALGLDRVYLQAKRFAEHNAVGASMLRDFVGSLELNGASKGVFITTSSFPKNAVELVSKSQKSIVLIEADELVALMLKYKLGVSVKKSYEIMSVDIDYFVEE